MNYFKSLLTTSGSDVIVDIATGAATAADGVTGISKALHDYGPLIVIFSIFIILFLGMALMILRSNSKLMDRVLKKDESAESLDQTIITKFVESALNKYTSSNTSNSKIEAESIVSQLNASLDEAAKKLADDIHGISKSQTPNTTDTQVVNNNSNHQNNSDKDYHKDIVGAYIDVSMTLKDASRSCLNKIKASRIAIYVFHNGNTSMCGLPFFKFSCIHEWTNNGNGTIRGRYHDNIPLQYFNDFIEDLWKNGEYKTTNIEEAIKSDPSLEEFTAYSHVKALYIVGVYDENDKLTGFIIAEFTNDEDFDTNEERLKEITDGLKEMNMKISPVIGHPYIYRDIPSKNND